MKLTMRERIMLIALSFAVLAAASYYLVAMPQLNKIRSMTEERKKVQAEVEKVKAEISPDNKLHQDYEALNKKIESKTIRFYPVILQDKLIITIDDMIRKTQLKADNIAFSAVEVKPLDARKQDAVIVFPTKDITEEFQRLSGNAADPASNKAAAPAANKGADPASGKDAKQNPPKAADPKKASPTAGDLVQKMSVSLQYTGNYGQLMSFISEVEALKRTVSIKNLAVTKTTGDALTGSVMLEFYALPKIHQQDQPYFEWPYQNQYGKDNPFK